MNNIGKVIVSFAGLLVGCSKAPDKWKYNYIGTGGVRGVIAEFPSNRHDGFLKIQCGTSTDKSVGLYVEEGRDVPFNDELQQSILIKFDNDEPVWASTLALSREYHFQKSEKVVDLALKATSLTVDLGTVKDENEDANLKFSLAGFPQALSKVRGHCASLMDSKSKDSL